MAHIGEKIKQRREELQMTQQELADKMGYKSRSTINKVELGINDIAQTTIYEYAKALSTTPAFLMGWEDGLTEENADFSIDMLDDPIFVEYAKKLFSADSSIKQQVYNYIDFLLRD